MGNKSTTELVSRVIPPAGKYLTPINKVYHSPTPGEITIAAITPNVGEEAPSIDLCRELESCGFNSALMSVTITQVSQALSACGSCGIRPLLFHSHLLRDEKFCSEYVERFKDDPNLGGWSLRDQPTYDELDDPDGFRRYYNLIYRTDPGHCIFVSLVGEAEPNHMDGHTYRQYLELFQDVLTLRSSPTYHIHSPGQTRI